MNPNRYCVPQDTPVPARSLTGLAGGKSNSAMARLRLAAIALLVAAASAQAAVRTMHVVERTDVLDGRSFAKSGPYEKIIARAWFTLDPKLPANQMIRDLNLAVADANGLVEFSADVHVLKPRDPSKGNGTILLEVPNRGGKMLLNRFCFGRTSNDPTKDEDFGDKWLLEEGYTLVWVGWQWDVPNRPGVLRLEPAPLRSDIPTPGLVRSEFVPEHPTTRMPLGDRDHTPIPMGKPIRLLVRDSTESLPEEIPLSKWKLSQNSAMVEMAEGFQPGRLYEFVYEGVSPVVTGLGLAAVRDIVAYLKHGGGDDVALLNDQSRYLKRSLGFGISQSGRFLRTFLYEGFNLDEQGRKVFDGVWADVGGAGRGSFNFRYAQASRDGNPWSNVFYPTDVFPFGASPEKDPSTGREAGLLDKATQANVLPKLFLTSTSYEYWGRAAALTHTRPDGLADAPIPPEVRAYFFSGAQHYPRSLPISKAGARHDSNPTDQRPFQRALLTSLESWLKDNVLPPPSVIPRLIKGELTSLDGLHFPRIPGVTPPRHPRLARRLDFGPEFLSKGYSTLEPPKVHGAFPLLVPQVDIDGNDMGGVKLPEVAVPLGTFTGWNLRAPGTGAPSQMELLVGSFIAFPRTKAERLRTNDSRLSIEERYADRADYMQRVASVVDSLVAQRFILDRDRTYVLERCGLLWDALIH